MRLLMNRKGFTLLELMIVIVIIGILAAVALPRFTAAVEKARVADAKTTLIKIRRGEEQYLAEHQTYLNVAQAAADTVWQKILIHANPGNDDWDYKVTGASATTFTATATRDQGPYDTKTVILVPPDDWSTGTHTLGN